MDPLKNRPLAAAPTPVPGLAPIRPPRVVSEPLLLAPPPPLLQGPLTQRTYRRAKVMEAVTGVASFYARGPQDQELRSRFVLDGQTWVVAGVNKNLELSLQAEAGEATRTVPLDQAGPVVVFLRGRRQEFYRLSVHDNHLFAERLNGQGQVCGRKEKIDPARVLPETLVDPDALKEPHRRHNARLVTRTRHENALDSQPLLAPREALAQGTGFVMALNGRPLIPDPNVRPVVGAQVTLGTLAELNDQIADILKRPSAGTLYAFPYLMKAKDDLGRPAPALDRLIQTLTHHAQHKGPVVFINQNPERLGPEAQARLAAAGVQFVQVDTSQKVGEKRVNHSKNFVVHDPQNPDRSVFVLSTARNQVETKRIKLEALVELAPALAEPYSRWMALAIAEGAAEARAQLLDHLAAHGVLLNDPTVSESTEHPQGGYRLTRAMNQLVNFAEKRLDLVVKELNDLDRTRALLDKARQGVQVNWVGIKIGEPDRKLIAAALAQDPTLPINLTLVKEDGDAFCHFNLVAADIDQPHGRATLGTSYFWRPQQLPWEYTNGYESGVLLDQKMGADILAQAQAYLEAHPPAPNG